jgi:ABC-2 type transport system ATP-binding protein
LFRWVTHRWLIIACPFENQAHLVRDTVFLTTQYLVEADELCDRLAVIQQGRLVATDAPDTLKSQVGGDILDVTLEDSTAEKRAHAQQVARESGLFEADTIDSTDEGITIASEHARRAGTDLLVALREAGFTVTGFDIRSPTLDDVFLAITGEPASDETADEDQPKAPVQPEVER